MPVQDAFLGPILSFAGPLKFDRGSIVIGSAGIVLMSLFVCVAMCSGLA